MVISHPDFPATQDLGLRWYANPHFGGHGAENWRGGYPFAPFNGHYPELNRSSKLDGSDRYNALKPWLKHAESPQKPNAHFGRMETGAAQPSPSRKLDAAGVTVGTIMSWDVRLSGGVKLNKTKGVMCLATVVGLLDVGELDPSTIDISPTASSHTPIISSSTGPCSRIDLPIEGQGTIDCLRTTPLKTTPTSSDVHFLWPRSVKPQPLEMTSHEIDYTIYGDDLQAVEIELDPRNVVAEAAP